MTIRLFPTPLEDIAGVKHEFLSRLSRTDAMRFLRREGVTGSRAELERAGEIYSFHPLMLKTAHRRNPTYPAERYFRCVSAEHH